MGPVTATDDTKRLISMFFNTKIKEREEIKEGYRWRLVKEIEGDDALKNEITVEIDKGLKYYNMIGSEEKVKFELAFGLMKLLE